MTPLADALSAALLHFVWQGIAVAVPCSIALFLLRRRSAAARYAVSCAALVLLAALPVVTTWMLYQPLPPVREMLARGGASAALRFDTPAAGFDWLVSAQAWAVPVWACGVLFFALRMVWGCAQVGRLRRSGMPASDAVLAMIARLARRLHVTRSVRALISTAAESPSVVGWVRPVILLPVSALAGLPPEQLEAVLAHELAHIRRHDYLVNLLQMAAESLLFYHPAVWWISARIRHERELCCDDVAASTCGGPLVYARALTALEKMRGATPAVAMGATGGKLLYRIRRLAGDSEAPSKLSGVPALFLALCCIALGVSWAQAPQAVPTAPPPPTPAIPSPALAPPAAPVPQPEASSTEDQAEFLRKAAAFFRHLAEEQLRREETDAEFNRNSLLGDKDVWEFRQKVIASQPNPDQAKMDQAQRELRTIADRLKLYLQEQSRLKTQRLQLQQYDKIRDQIQRSAERASEPLVARTYRLHLEGITSMLGSLFNPEMATLDRLEFTDVPTEKAKRLEALLPVKAGDTVTVWSPYQIAQAIYRFDPNLRFRFLRENDSVVLFIEPAK